MVTRLRQATAHPGILSTENIPSGKIDRCCDLLEQIISDGNKCVVFSTFKETIDAIKERIPQYKPLIGTGDIPDEQISNNVDKFQNCEDNKVFLGTWQKCGTGLTLTSASYMIFIDTPWTDAAFEQACDRIYRIGTTKPVTIYNLITSDTIDERVNEIVNDKGALADYIIDDTITESGLNSLRKYIEELR
jgi:SNF2 family DNA or RNA helicase